MEQASRYVRTTMQSPEANSTQYGIHMVIASSDFHPPVRIPAQAFPRGVRDSHGLEDTPFQRNVRAKWCRGYSEGKDSVTNHDDRAQV
jgi:hypothetical protein